MPGLSLGKNDGAERVPRHKIENEVAGLVKKTCAAKINGNGITVRLNYLRRTNYVQMPRPGYHVLEARRYLRGSLSRVQHARGIFQGRQFAQVPCLRSQIQEPPSRSGLCRVVSLRRAMPDRRQGAFSRGGEPLKKFFKTK